MVRLVGDVVFKEDKLDSICMDIWGKKADDVKYLLVTNYIHQQLLDEELTRTGLYQWINVFKGHVMYKKDVVDFNDYDIVQVNMATQDLHIINDIKEQLVEGSKTKIVVNNDYTTEMWGRSFSYVPTVKRELAGADMLFGTEYFQTTALSEISGRKCFVIPHPADIKRLKSLSRVKQKNIISTIWRRYDQHSYIPSLVVRNHGLTTQLIGYDKNVDQKVHLTTTLYDYVFAGTNFFDFCNQMQESKIVYDPFTFHSYSRATVDAAALGVAVVGSNRTQSMNVCYPYTVVDPYDVKSARELIRKLLVDKEFYGKVVETALEKSEFYNHINSKERFLLSLQEALKDNSDGSVVVKKKFNDVGVGDNVLNLIAGDKNREKNGKK